MTRLKPKELEVILDKINFFKRGGGKMGILAVIGLIYCIGIFVMGFLGVVRMLEYQEIDMLLLTPVWPILYIKYLWKSLI